MFSNYFKVALRNILRFKVYSLINVTGLSVGITCAILILLFVTDEISFDKYHSKADRIYRVIEHIKPVEESSSLPFPVAEALKTDYPNFIDEYVRFFDFQAPTLSMEYAPENGTKVQFNEPRVFFADSTLFKVFDFKLKLGNPGEVLNKPLSVLITEATAKRYFGNDNPIGKNLSLEGQHNLTVTGVLEDTPLNSHFKFDFIVSFSSLHTLMPSGIPKVWYWNPCWTYVLLKENTNPEILQSSFPEFVKRRYPPARGEQTALYLQPLTDIHLHSKLDFEIEANGDITLVYIFAIIAFFILLIAAINFINLSTARSLKRAREVGVRKVMGAVPKQLIAQFLSESIIITSIAVILAIPFVDLFLPVLNRLALKEISFFFITNGMFWASLLFIVILVGLVGGIYPAFFLSSFQPVKVLSGKIEKFGSGALLRKALVISQFAISCILIIGTIITYNQLNHLRNANLGFDKEEVILLPIDRSPVTQNYDRFKDRIVRHKSIKSVSVANMVMGTETQSSRYTMEGSDTEISLSSYWIGTDFGKTLGMTFLAGRDFNASFPSDTARGGGGVLVNESFLKFAGWEDPESAIGKKITGRADGEMIVKGVIKGFHFTSLKQPITPLVLVLLPLPEDRASFRKYVYVRVDTKDLDNVLPFLEEKFKEFDPSRAFSYSFLDERINRLYSAENLLGKIATVFSIMAIFVACLGLFGLSSFTAEQRTKEIGVRKVLGASIASIVLLLSKQFLILVVIANLLAWPVAYYIMNYWLSNFQTQIGIDAIPFIAAAVFTFVIAFTTMSWQAIKSAIANPVESLRYE
jgi:putative ABC transport system permease protein